MYLWNVHTGSGTHSVFKPMIVFLNYFITVIIIIIIFLPSWTLENQRNIRNFRTECHIPLQLTEPSLPECLPSGSAAQWEQIARNTKSDTGDRGGGRQRKLCQGAARRQ